MAIDCNELNEMRGVRDDGKRVMPFSKQRIQSVLVTKTLQGIVPLPLNMPIIS